jgi:hypothetical protein
MSPFNIKDAFNIQFFDKEESKNLFDQFEEEYHIKVDDEVQDEIFEYTKGLFILINFRHPGLFCVCGRIIQDYIELNKLNHFTFNIWKELIGEGTIIFKLQNYPTTSRILSDFNISENLKRNDIDLKMIEKSKEIFNRHIFQDIETEFKLDRSLRETKFLSNYSNQY